MFALYSLLGRNLIVSHGRADEVCLRRPRFVVVSSLDTFDFASYASPGLGLVTLAIMAGFSRSLRQSAALGYSYGLSLSRVLPFVILSLHRVIPLSAVLTRLVVYTLPTLMVAATCCWLRPRSLPI